MRQHKGKLVFLLAVISVNIVAGRWLKIYDENYHRPTYYNRAHRSSNHVDYDREALERRDYRAPKVKPTLPPFDPKTHHSFYVNVLYKGSVICAGALISRRMILTSSRCFLADEREPSHEFRARDMTILTGNHFGKQARHVYPVRAFFLPAGAVKYEDVHRVALLALYDKLPKGTYRYIGLYRNIAPANANVTMSYVDSYSRDITLAKTKVVPRRVCRESYYKINKVQMPIDKDMFCVKNKRKGGCSTRPGDPLIIDNALAGINIYGEHCDELEGSEIVDVYYTTHYSVRFIQDATDMYRALTGTSPFNSSQTTKRHQLYTGPYGPYGPGPGPYGPGPGPYGPGPGPYGPGPGPYGPGPGPYGPGPGPYGPGPGPYGPGPGPYGPGPGPNGPGPGPNGPGPGPNGPGPGPNGPGPGPNGPGPGPNGPPGTQATQGWHTTDEPHTTQEMHGTVEPHTTEEMPASSESHTTEDMSGSSPSNATEDMSGSSPSNATEDMSGSSPSNATGEMSESSEPSQTTGEVSESIEPSQTTEETTKEP